MADVGLSPPEDSSEVGVLFVDEQSNPTSVDGKDPHEPYFNLALHWDS